MDPDLLLAGLQAGNTAALARAISVVENARPGFERLLADVHPLAGPRHVASASPARPGAGKSTLVERLVTAYRQAGLRVAVVAVDPTSPFTGGALLGDRIRMESVALDEGVYIRSMGSRGSLGGLATTTREVCDLLDAAGFDRILVETVGVGQSELDVARMADATVLVLVPESGDGIQTLKSGVMEIADLFVVNKADRAGAEKLRQEIEVTLGIRRGNAFRNVPAHHGIGRAVGRSGGRRSGGRSSTDAGRPASVRPTARPTAVGVRRSCSPSPPRATGSPSCSRPSTGTTRGWPPAARWTSAGAGGCSTGRARWWTGPRAAGSGRRPGPSSGSASGWTRSWPGGLSPYDVAAEVLDGLKQGERI